ncbi:MAG: TIGR02757 family protein [Muribaculaceae bacterium]|nr:TIGR02757 family protein [Muribaculaceae bacterium]
MDKNEFQSLKDFLDREARRINSTDFIADDPVQFPRRFSKLQDIEIVAMLSATIAWGNRKMIRNNCEKMLAIMDNDPYAYLMDGAYESLPDGLNIHRTFFVRNFKNMLRGLSRIYASHDSLQAFARHHHVGNEAEPAWKLVEHIQNEFMLANGCNDPRCLPTKLNDTALKRVNMALRWLVRNDGIVDMGVWNVIKPAQLFIPLDVHVGNTARSLGLITRKANDKRTVLELTDVLRQMRPDDPVLYDYALFGIGVSGQRVNQEDVS